MDAAALKEYGPLGIIVALLLWFQWQSWKRNNKLYDDLSKRVRQLEDEKSALLADLAQRTGLRVLDSFGLQNGKAVRLFPNLLAGTSVYTLSR